jgi:hypothetical protein
VGHSTQAIDAKTQVALDIKARQLAVSEEPDLVRRAEQSVALPVALKWAEEEIASCKQVELSARGALEDCVLSIHGTCGNAAALLRRDYIAKLCSKIRTLTGKALGKLDEGDLLKMVSSSETVEQRATVSIPFLENKSIDHWRECVAELKKLADA